jgi:uncharacterized protein
MNLVDEIGGSRYVSLTTYRKDGTAVATPVWFVVDGDELLIVSEADAWKVKRLRNNNQVVVTVCDFRGRTAPDASSARGEARLLDDTGTQRARALLAKRYLMSRLGNRLARILRLRRPPVIAIAIALTTAPGS